MPRRPTQRWANRARKILYLKPAQNRPSDRQVSRQRNPQFPPPPTSSSPSNRTRTLSGSDAVRGQQRLKRLYLRSPPALCRRPRRAHKCCRSAPWARRAARATRQAGRAAAHHSGRKPAPSACPWRAASRHKPADGLRLNKPHVLHADALQVGGQRLGGLAAIAFVLRQRGNGWNAQQRLQVIEKTRIVLAGKGNCGRRHEFAPFKKTDKSEYRSLSLRAFPRAGASTARLWDQS